jgi:uncharacterized protein (TIGR03086 family)
MTQDLLNLYERASDWMNSMVPVAAEQLDAPTLCDGWNVEMLMNHVLDTQRYFIGAARGTDEPLPAPQPPSLIGANPAVEFEAARAELLIAYRVPGVIQKTGPALGIAFSDQLLHGWDLAKATAQDSTMPEGLPEQAFEIIHGLFTEEQRMGVFKPEIEVTADASAQQRLLAYAGRDPLS